MNQDILQHFFEPIELNCPTCGLSFQDNQECRRCKTDLTLLMQTVKYSWKVRDKARQLLLNHDYDQALHSAQKAQAIHRTKMGELIEQLAWTALEKRCSARTHLQTILFE